MLAYTPDLPLVETFAATYYIYVLKNPINNKVFYVGKTAKELKVRLSGHLSETAGNTDKAKCVQDILQKGERPIIEAIETIYGISYLDKLKSCEREYFWIKHYKKVYPHLTNKFGTEEGYFHSEYSAYKASVANGETNWYYYYCGKTKYGIKVYDEEKMNEDGFRFPQDKSEMMPTQPDVNLFVPKNQPVMDKYGRVLVSEGKPPKEEGVFNPEQYPREQPLPEELVSKHLESIEGMNCIYGETPKVDKDDERESAKSCTAVTLDYMGRILECCPSVKIGNQSFLHVEHQYDKNIWIDDDTKIYKTQQLIELFFQKSKK